MNETEERIEQLKSITIDPDFEKVCPPLTEDEFSQLEQNILSDGAVTSPLVVWNNILIDGHHRRQIILKHPELEYHIQEVTLPTRAEAIAWICKNQVGRRNLTPKQLVYLIGMSEEGLMTEEGMLHLMSEVKGNQVEYVKVPMESLRSYFRPETSMKQMTETIVKAMEYYKQYLERQRNNRDAR